jgi:hypothetical protein
VVISQANETRGKLMQRGESRGPVLSISFYVEVVMLWCSLGMRIGTGRHRSVSQCTTEKERSMSVTKTRSCSPSHYLGRIQQGPAEECKVNLVISCSDSRKQNVTSHIHTPLNPLQQDDLHHEAEEPRGLAFEKAAYDNQPETSQMAHVGQSCGRQIAIAIEKLKDGGGGWWLRIILGVHLSASRPLICPTWV